MKPLRALAASILLMTIAACGTTAADTAFSQEQLTQLADAFQSELDRLYQRAKTTDEIFPGATAAFILPDGEVIGVATGHSDVEAEIRMTPDMVMPSGSIGKTYVSAVVLSLVHEGILELDDKVAKWLGNEPWFSRLPNGEDITLRTLLNHSSGLIDHAFDAPEFLEALGELAAGENPDAYLTPRELVEFALDRDPLFSVGKGFNYTDTGYIIVGIVIEKATGSTYYAELQQRILDPLDLTFTLPQDRRSVPHLAQGYGVASAEIFGTPVKVVEEGTMVFNPLIEWTGGGLFNNPQDLVRWAKALYEGEVIEGPYLDDLLRSTAWEGFEDSTRVYGLGVVITQGELGTTYGHSGFFPGYNSQMLYFPEHRVAVAMQINTDRSRVGAHTQALARVVLAALE